MAEQKVNWLTHPKFPGAQPFQGKGSKCKSKVNSWWTRPIEVKKPRRDESKN